MFKNLKTISILYTLQRVQTYNIYATHQLLKLETQYRERVVCDIFFVGGYWYTLLISVCMCVSSWL